MARSNMFNICYSCYRRAGTYTAAWTELPAIGFKHHLRVAGRQVRLIIRFAEARAAKEKEGNTFLLSQA